MNRMTKLFQQKSNRAFDQYLLAKRKSLSDTVRDDHGEHRHAVTLGQQQEKGWPTIQDLACAVLKAESDCWSKAAELLRKEEPELSFQASPRATVPRLSISIESIPHSLQRYNTCGDWYQGGKRNRELVRDKEVLCVLVSELPDRREMFLVAIHELVEAFLCECAEVTERQTDDFDMDPNRGEACPDEGHEPGDCASAPYYRQHQFATGIERILAAEVGVDWLTYEQHVKELSL